MAAVMLPRGERMRGPRGAIQALVCLAKQLREVVRAVLLEVEARQQGRRENAKIQFQMMILWRNHQHSILVQFKLLVGGDSERKIPIVLRKEPRAVVTWNSGPTLRLASVMSSTTVQSS
jgi:hypothetical protein